MYTSNIERIYEKLVEKYKNVYTCEIGDEFYIYKLLTKLEYEALTSQIEDELDLQDAVVETCVLYPEDLIADDMLPGDVYQLSSIIVANSYVLPEDRLLMLEAFSAEMSQLDNVICSLILRAFPSYRWDELENMTYPELYKMYCRAEWYLLNVAQEPLEFSAIDTIKQSLYGTAETKTSDYYSNGHDEENNEEVQYEAPQQEEVGKYMGRKLSDVMSEINNSGSKRKPMTEEQRIELEKFKQQFPDIRMDQDAMYTGILSEKAGVARNTPRQKY